MFFKKELKKPILALLFLSLGGWFLHFRIHPISVSPSHFVPFFYGLVSILIVPVMLNYKKTVIIGYVVNGFSVIVGTVLMAHLSFSDFPQPITLPNILFQTTLADIFILLPKLFIGQMILLYYYPNGLGRLFTTRWWIKHFCYFAIVYSIGHFLMR